MKLEATGSNSLSAWGEIKEARSCHEEGSAGETIHRDSEEEEGGGEQYEEANQAGVEVCSIEKC